LYFTKTISDLSYIFKLNIILYCTTVIIIPVTTLCLRKNAPTLKQCSSKLYGSILMTFGRNIQQFACFSFHVGLLFYQLFVFQTGHRK